MARESKAIHTIRTSPTLGRWLNGKPGSWGKLIATRAALRVLPLTLEILEHSSGNRSLKVHKTVTLEAFRAAFVAWVMTFYGTDNPRLKQSARSCKLLLPENIMSLSAASHGAIVSASYAVSLNVAPEKSERMRALLMDTVSSAAQSAGAANGRLGTEALWESIRADASWITDRKESELIRQPLWLRDVRGNPRYQANFPPWVRSPFDRFDQSELVKAGPWGIWLSWYRAILPNGLKLNPRSAFGEDTDFLIAGQPSKFWSRDPDVVMENIARIVERHTYAVDRPVDEIRKAKPRKTRKASKPQLRKSQTEAVDTHSDEPTANDQLGRRPFAQALVERMNDVRKKGGADGFAVHLHGPWGAGKTSIMLMMEEFLADPDRESSNRWAVVHFNAWHHERRKPPWWPLIEAVRADCFGSLWRNGRGTNYFRTARSRWRALALSDKWLCWKIRADWLPLMLASCVLLLFHSCAVRFSREGKNRLRDFHIIRSGRRSLCFGRPISRFRIGSQCKILF